MTHRTNNPYASPYAIEEPHLFYGRVDLLRSIFQKLMLSKYPSSLQIVGMNRIGKTSLLNVLACLNKPTYLPIVQTLSLGFEPTLLSRLIFVRIDALELATHKSATFWSIIQEKLLQSVKEHFIMPEWSDQSNKTDGLAAPQQWPETQGSESFDIVKKRLLQLKNDKIITVFLFDEFDHIVQHLSDVLPNLRFLLENNKGYLVYITTVRKELSQHEYYTKEKTAALHFSPLFNYFAPSLYLGLLEKTSDQQISTLFIYEQAKKQNVFFTNEDITFAMRIGGRHPEITRIACKHLFDERQEYPDDLLDYRQLQQFIFEDSEGLLQNTINGELCSLQQQALEHLAERTDLDDIPEATWHTLEKRGLIVSIPSRMRYEFFSPILAYFFHALKYQVTQASMIRVWPDQRIVQVGPKLELLSPNEWKIFSYLYAHHGMICTREDLLQLLGSELSPSALEITISRLRQKIEEEPDKPRFIITVRGQGYRFVEHFQNTQSLLAPPGDEQPERLLPAKSGRHAHTEKQHQPVQEPPSPYPDKKGMRTAEQAIEEFLLQYQDTVNRNGVNPEEFANIVGAVISLAHTIVSQSDISIFPRISQIMTSLLSKMNELNGQLTEDMIARMNNEKY